MSFHAALLMPLALLLPAAGALEAEQSKPAGADSVLPDRLGRNARPGAGPDADASPVSTFQNWPFRFVAQGLGPEPVYQVRIEQRMTIRITPRAPARPNALVGLPDREIGPEFVERKIGKCLPVSGISGVQTHGGNRILLFMRDRRIVRAELERSCRARDFYSGFYLSQSPDGQMCVDRDVLQSRNGANCKLTRIRQLVEVGH